MSRRNFAVWAAALYSGSVWSQPVSARQYDLTVSQVGSRLHAVPFLIARDRGWFRELAGINVRGFIGSSGGGTSLRNALAADLPYGEVSLAAAISALSQGVELTIVHGGVQTLADQFWVVRTGETGLNTRADLKGRRLGYSATGSLSDMVSRVMIESAGLENQLERRVVGPVKAALEALRDGTVDIVMISEPMLSRSRETVRPVWSAAEVFGPCMQTVGVARSDWLLRNGSTMRGIIAARRKAVHLIRDEPPQAALVISGEHGIAPARALQLVERLLGSGGLWSDGAFHPQAIQALEQGLKKVGVLSGAGEEWRRAVRADYLS